MLRTIEPPLMIFVLVSGLILAPIQQARAHDGAGTAAGIAAGIIGLGILGAAAGAREDHYYASDGECYPGPRECYWSHRRCFEDPYGDWVCRGGEYVCRRPLICD